MKATTIPIEEFNPIKITLESKEEITMLKELLNISDYDIKEYIKTHSFTNYSMDELTVLNKLKFKLWCLLDNL